MTDKLIQFPPVTAEGEAKLRRLIDSISLFMNATVKVEPMIVLTVTIPEIRQDMITVIKKLSDSMRKLGIKEEKPDKEKKL